MMPTYLNLFAAYLAWFLVGKFCHAELDNGFGLNIDWTTLDDGLYAAREQNKIVMVVIHMNGCGACNAFKPRFATSDTIRELSRQFVMVNVEVNDLPVDERFHPDGRYVPRILFFDPNGNLMKDIHCRGRTTQIYNYSSADAVVASMQDALYSHKTLEMEK